MRRRTKIIWASIVGAAALGIGILWSRSDLVRHSDATLETLLANASQSAGATGEPAVPGAPRTPGAPSAEKDWVVKSIRDATGRTFDVEGEFDAWLLPLPGMLLGRATLSNAPGFGDSPFAVIDGMEVRVGSVSPFEQRVVIERAALAGLRLNLARNAAGQDNWSDMSATPVAASPAAPSAGGASGGPANPASTADAADPAATAVSAGNSGDWTASVEAIEITDAEINWQDAVTGGYWKLSGFDFLASEIEPGADFPMTFSFAFERDAVAVSIDSEMRAFPLADGLRLENLSFDFGDVDPGDLRSLFASTVVTGDPELAARAGASPSIGFTGGGTFNGTTQALDLSGELKLADGAVVPAKVRGTLQAPAIELAP